VVVIMMAAASAALADSVELPRWVLGSGASDSTAGSTSLHATLGQPVVGVVAGGDVSLGQGFWHGGATIEDHYIFLPLVLR